MNPLYNQFGNNPLSQFANQLEQFRKTFTGDPRAEVQKMLNSGKLSQAQYNRYAQMATQIQKALNIK